MFNIFKKIQFDKTFKECEDNYKTLKKDIQNYCESNHNYKSSIKKAITTQKEKPLSKKSPITILTQIY